MDRSLIPVLTKVVCSKVIAGLCRNEPDWSETSHGDSPRLPEILGLKSTRHPIVSHLPLSGVSGPGANICKYFLRFILSYFGTRCMVGL